MTGHGAAPVHELPLYLSDLRQLFDSMAPAPFRERDLDGKASGYIVDCARDAPAGVPLVLVVHLGREPGAETAAIVRQAVDDHFGRCAEAKRRELRKLFHVGRISLVIGLIVLGGAMALSQIVGSWVRHEGYAGLLSESLIIGGWVALWRPLEIFLYDWWPIRAEARLFDRLATMPVRLLGTAGPGEAVA